jgi:peptidyl-prolyl cis-trans isomerase SurA
VKWNRDPDCAIPEQLAVTKLFLHQAVIDSIDRDVTETDIAASIDEQINRWIDMIGSREKLEEYKKTTISQLKTELHDDFRNQLMVQKMQQKLVSDIKVTPAEVRRYFKDMPQDSLPYVPTEVEVQIITQTPRIAPEEINRVKDQLREFTDRINRGDATFAMLARLYSQDGSARNGGELGYTGRGQWVPEFANVAFNLTDPKKVSKIVETEFGFHIIQLIDKRGDKVNARHILLKPEVSDSAITASMSRLDSVATSLRAGTVPLGLQPYFIGEEFTFEDGVTFYSDDKDTRKNRGLMATSMEQTGRQTSKFRLAELPPEVARVVDTMQVNQISAPFTMINKNGKTVCVIAKLKSRTDGHKATVTEDFQVMKDVVLAKRREKVIHDWVVDKIKSTYVRINENYRNCDFEYQGWVR